MWQTIQTQASSIWTEFKNGLEKFLALVIALALILTWAIHRLERAVYQQDLAATSLLRSASRITIPARNYRPRLPGGNGIPSCKNGACPLPHRPDSIPGNTTETYLPPEATVNVTPKDPTKNIDDLVDVTITGTYGLTFQPGLDIVTLPLGVGLDVKLAYYEKIGFELGAEKYFILNQAISPSIGVSYRMDEFWMLKNTELKMSYAPGSSTIATVGLRLSF